MQFTKMHGIGNDYVYVNGFAERIDDPAALARQVADRHFGVGGDGLILVLPPEPGVEADVRMRMFNADGSEAEMCGNGVRCVAKYACDHNLTTARPMRVQTGAGVLTIDYTRDHRGKLVDATVNMGEPILEAAKIPVKLDNLAPTARVVSYDIQSKIDWHPAGAPPHWLEQAGLIPEMTCVSMGNPHATIYCRNVQRVPLEAIGPVLENHPMFPRRMNIHFVEIHDRGEVTMRTWERGSGITLACGTGASAVCVAGVLTGKTDRDLLAHLPGGDLKLEWREADHRLYMTGPATEIFTGVWPGC